MASLYTKIIAEFLFPIHEQVKGHETVRIRRALEKTQWLSAPALADLQSNRMRAFLNHAYLHVPYYRKRFDAAGINPADVKSIQELQYLPLLTKADIRSGFDELRADDAGSLARSNTGGSSGEPLTFLIGKRRISHDVAAKWRATRWWGVDVGDPEIVIWGSPVEVTAQDVFKEYRDRLLRTRLLSAFDLSEHGQDQILSVIKKTRPAMLFGYPSALALLAQRAISTNIEITGVHVAFVTSERLYDHQRGLITKAFGCRVANGYGGRDAGFIAHECPDGGMHISAENIIVEIIDENGGVLPAGESGEIVVTQLATGDFPFLRYRTGDIGMLDDNSCACGRGLPLLKEIQGRTTDFVVAANGTIMHGLALIYILRDLEGLANFRIVQETIQDIEVSIVPGPGFDRSVLPVIVDGIRQRLGQSVHVVIRLVDDIPRETSGKHRYIVSKVTPSSGTSQQMMQ